MNTLHGRVSDYHTDTSVSGGGENSSVSTTHYAHFMLDSQKVLIEHHAPVMIGTGDRVSVTGELRDGIFHGRAWYNHTLRHIAYPGHRIFLVLGLLIGVIAPAVAVAVGSFFISDNQTLQGSFFLVMGGLSLMFGVYVLNIALTNRRAIRQLNASLRQRDTAPGTERER